jgi:hypothetical protein
MNSRGETKMKEYVKGFVEKAGHRWDEHSQEMMKVLVSDDAQREGLTVLRTEFHHSDSIDYTTGWAVAICEKPND